MIFMIAGFGFLLGYHFQIMENQPAAWMLFCGVVSFFSALLYRLQYLERRISILEFAFMILAQKTGNAGEDLASQSRTEGEEATDA